MGNLFYDEPRSSTAKRPVTVGQVYRSTVTGHRYEIVSLCTSFDQKPVCNYVSLSPGMRSHPGACEVTEFQQDRFVLENP